ncbi:MAG: M20/M25/M40 family metallo-hydrolase, partial [Deltaproteobacteria bacterium]|nr:M20/M25/M40 family metallo-hydrolase [Deltaproteobacteria bacterium]
MNIKFKNPTAAARIALSTLSLVFLLIIKGWTTEIPSPTPSTSDELVRHVRYLASDELMGRGVDTPGINMARDYIAQEFKKYGLVPGGENGTYLQRLEVVTGARAKESSTVSFGKGSPLGLNEEWVPLGLSRSGIIEGEVIFVGYGITAKDYGYDDYAGVDVKGKIVLVLRYEPPPKNEKSPFRKHPDYSNHASLRAKATNARDHGAIGMILVDLHPARQGQEELIPLRRSLGRSDGSLIAVQVRRQSVEKWLQEKGVSLSAFKEKIDLEERPASISLAGLRASLNVSLEKITTKTDNVIGILPGSDPQLKEENIVIGAHYDHLGLGYFGTRDTSTEGQIHNGADDNASGTAVVLNLAERLSRHPGRTPRTIVFVAFTGEELGLYGSRHYVTHSPFPIASTRAMINLDMVGRLKDNRVTVFGLDTVKEFVSLVTEVGKETGIEIRPSSRGIGRSDHVSFYNKNIPVLHFFTGSHNDYHRPTDDWEKLNTEGMAKVSDLILTTVKKIASAKEPLTFVRVPSPPARPEGGEGYGAYLGTIPDFAEAERGVPLAGVQSGSPAEGAGLKEGDIIIQLAGIEVQNLEDLVSALRSKKPGERV